MIWEFLQSVTGVFNGIAIAVLAVRMKRAGI